MTNRLLVLLCAMVALCGVIHAQTTPPPQSLPKEPVPPPHHQRWHPVTGAKILPPPLYQDESPIKRMERIGTSEDPGPDPDPNKKWHRFGKTYIIQKFKRIDAAYDARLGWVRPMWPVNVAKEIYQENAEYVWVWMEDKAMPEQVPGIDAARAREAAAGSTPGTPAYVKYEGQGLEFVLQVKDEFRTVEPPPVDVTLRFRESSEGLPQDGSWRNALDVADMNEDGHLDLVVPPARVAIGSVPAIFLGDGTGRWKLWTEARWPAAFSYGTAAVGDLNGDRHQDAVFAIHLHGIAAFLGDGKGNFVESSQGLPGNFPTRRVALADVDRDGDLDIVAISEGAIMGMQRITAPLLRAYLNENRAKEWKLQPVADPKRSVAGDWMAIGNFNGDPYPDIAGASVIFSGTDLIYLSEAKGQWKPFGRGWLPFYSYYGAMAAGKLTSKKRDDLIMTFIRFWPDNADPAQIPPPPFRQVVGIDRISFRGEQPQRSAIARWQGERPIWGLATADFDADRNQDIIYWDSTTRKIKILLGNGRGTFHQGTIEGLDIPSTTLYDIKVADVNADKRPDVILMFESDEDHNNGSIRVWLGEPGAGRAGPHAVAKRLDPACKLLRLKYNPRISAVWYDVMP